MNDAVRQRPTKSETDILRNVRGICIAAIFKPLFEKKEPHWCAVRQKENAAQYEAY